MNRQVSCSGCDNVHCVASAQPEFDRVMWNVTPWRAALNSLLGAPLRLHRYRNLRAEVIDDALRAFGNRPKHGDRS